VREDVAISLNNGRAEDKRELHRLNDLLAEYLERLSHLQFEYSENVDLKKLWEQDLKIIKDTYENDVTFSTRQLEESSRIGLTLGSEVTRLEAVLLELKRKIAENRSAHNTNSARIKDLWIQLTTLEFEVTKITRTNDLLRADYKLWEDRNERLRQEIERIKSLIITERNQGLNFKREIDDLINANEKIYREEERKLIELLRGRGPGPLPGPGPVDSDCRDIALAITGIRESFERWLRENQIDYNWLSTIKGTTSQIDEARRYANEINALRVTLDGIRAEILDYESKNVKIRTDLYALHLRLTDESRICTENCAELKPRLDTIVKENLSLQVKIRELVDTKESLRSELEMYKKLIEGTNVRSAFTRHRD